MRISSPLLVLSTSALAFGLAAQKPTGPATPPHVFVESGVDSGYIHNTSNAPRVVFTHTFRYTGTEWMNLKFGEHTNLPNGSFLRLTGTRDNVNQRLDGRALADWAMWSASFNGGEMVVELVAGPSTRANRVVVPSVVRGLPAWVEPETICGNTDDRVRSNDMRQGRLWLGCTGWLAGIVAGNTLDLMLTAGHCTSSGPRILEFNVPDSQPNGTVVRSAPNDQYPYTILQRLNTGVGSDWQVATVSANSNTNRRPTQVNGGAFYQLGTVPTSTGGQNITITGYGTTSPRNQLSQIQKTHTGGLAQIRATSLCYTPDTTGGNSGSPVIHANNGRAIGIHTHGGCTSSGGCNQGTRIDRADLQAAIQAAGKTPGTFTQFGTGCLGTGQGPSFCASNNSSGGTLANSSAPNEYAYIASANTALQVTGFEVYTSTNNNSTATVPTAIYADNNGAPGAQLATGTMTVGGTPGFYRSTFSSTVSIPAGTFYVSIDHANSPVYLANLSSGTPGAAFWRRSGTSWARSGIITNSSFRVLCAGGGGSGAVPTIGNTGIPEINTTYTVTGSQGRASAPAFLAVGGSNTQWSGGSLPFSLASLGAPNCNLRVSLDLLISAQLNSSGAGSVQIPVPNVSALIGQSVYHQWIVVDGPANNLGLAFSAGARATIGG